MKFPNASPRIRGILFGAILGAWSAAQGAEQHTLRVDGQAAVFEVAENELYNVTRDRVEPVPPGRAARAAAEEWRRSSADAREIVLYPRHAPRTEWTRRVLTRRVLARLAPGTDAAGLARTAGAEAAGEVSYAPGYHLFLVNETGAALTVAARLRTLAGVESAEPLLGRQLRRKFTPGDPLFGSQWGLLNTGQNGATAGVDINVTNAWVNYRGAGIHINIVDDGLQYAHPDLASNYNAALSYDYRDGDADPRPEGSAGVNGQGNPNADSHGTATAGIAGARGNNAIGSSGVAFEATLIGVRLIGGNSTDEMEGNAISHSNAVVHVSNNSWGPDDDGTVKGGAGPLAMAALRTAALQGRGGRGTILVWAGGNGGAAGDNANYDSYNSSIYTVSVGALNDLGQKADYSERGACLVVSAPAGAENNGRPQGSITTDLLGDFGYNRSDVATGAVNPADLADRDYTQNYNGTSCAAPMVSGVVALMLQANPNLGWRDVQEILIRTAAKTDPAQNEWQTNRAGLAFNPSFGAGLVNADAAVRLATNWANLGPQLSNGAARASLALAVPDNDANGVVESFDMSATNLRLEHVVLTVSATHAMRGDLAITLISPGGMASPLTELHGDTGANYEGQSFRSNFHWGEDSKGVWQVRVADRRAGNTGTVTALHLAFHGMEPPRPTLMAQGLQNGAFAFTASVTPALTYNVQASATLNGSDWSTLGSFFSPSNSFRLTHEGASPANPRVFYRLSR